jgi:hypothetical protein
MVGRKEGRRDGSIINKNSSFKLGLDILNKMRKVTPDQHSKTCGFPCKTATISSQAAPWFTLTIVDLDSPTSFEDEG